MLTLRMANEAASGLSLDQSDWREAPLHVDQTIFVVRDVHGCHEPLGLLLETFAALATDRRATLIFLGDLICRGPSSLTALSLWAAPSLEQSFARVHRLAGNHEQLLMLSIGSQSVAQAAHDKWMTIDGNTFVDELRSATGRPNAALTRELLHEGVGLKVLQRLDLLEHNVRIGNTIFVHGGIDPSLDPVDRPRRAIHDVRREPLGLGSGAVSRVAQRLRRRNGGSWSHAARETSGHVGLSRPACVSARPLEP